MAEIMKTWQYTTIDGKLEDCLVCNKSATPPDRSSLSRDQLVVEVITAALNPVDYKLPESGFMGSMMIARPATPGLDFCGRVVAKHPANDTTELGQLIFGGLPQAGKFGSLGQFMLTSTKETTPLPKGVNPDDAAAVGTAATTAYQSLLPGVDISGWKVFLNGGSGGVGSWATQFAKVKGAHVTVACSTANAEFCKQLGADEVIDYKKTDIIDALKGKGQVYDMVVDNVGNESLYASSDAFLRPGGWFVQVGTGPLSVGSMSTTMARHLRPSWFNSGKRNYRFIMQANAAEFFLQIGQWMSEAKVRAIIDQTFEWDNAPSAIAAVRAGRTKGKIVVHVGKH
jgi:NADPH:quinone reductase-like Zn-dependent oxidoreductase